MEDNNTLDVAIEKMAGNKAFKKMLENKPEPEVDDRSQFKKDLDLICAGMKYPVASFRFKLNGKLIGAEPVEAIAWKNKRGYNLLKRCGINTIGEVLNKWDDIGNFKGAGIEVISAVKMGTMSLYYDKLSKAERKLFWRECLQSTGVKDYDFI